MNELAKIFEYEGVQVRTVIRDGEVWFVVKDVCDILDIANSRDTVSRLDEDEKGLDSIDTLGGPQSMQVVNEFGLYSLILGSRKPEAKQFKRFVTHEVLPMLRKTGKYELQQAQPLQLTQPDWPKVVGEIEARKRLLELVGIPKDNDLYKSLMDVQEASGFDLSEYIDRIRDDNRLELLQMFERIAQNGSRMFGKNIGTGNSRMMMTSKNYTQTKKTFEPTNGNGRF